ncbi:hypothetical protein MMC17_010169 [Xylographa soralifera]|nr:hypothetical protein [Xylographa soralifera]
MALLVETVPTFEDTWIECLGDLGGYRMAIEDVIRDREVWSGIVRFFSTSNGEEPAYYDASLMETTTIEIFGSLCKDRSLRKLPDFVQHLSRGLRDIYPKRIIAKFKEQGVFAARSNVLSVSDYSIFRASKSLISSATNVALATLSIALKRTDDKNVYPFLHLYLVFIYGLIGADKIISLLQTRSLWTKLTTFLDFLSKAMTFAVFGEQSPRPEEGIGQPLPEDFLTRGKLWTEFLFPDTWFLNSTAKARADIDSEAQTASTRRPTYWPEISTYLSTVYDYGLRRKRSGPNRAYYIALLFILAGPILATDHMAELPSITETISTQSRHFRPEPRTTAVSHMDKMSLPGTLNSRPESLWVPTVTANPGVASASKFVPELLITSDSNSGDNSPEPHATTLSHWTFPILCIIMLMICWQIAKIAQWEPIHVSGTLAVVAWWLWLYLKRYQAISP